MNWQQDTSALPHRRVAALMIAAGILTQQAVLGQTQPSRAPGQWNDTLCHNPSEPNCNPCWIDVLAPTTPPSNETETKIWSGQPGEYPEVKPWYNGAGSAPSGPPAGKARCSSCIDRYLDNFREMLASKPPSCNCATIPNPPFIPCGAAAPGLYGCACYCAYEQQLPIVCNIDTTVANYPGPCALVKMRATQQHKPFTLTCDFDGYYNLKQTGTPPAVAGSSEEEKAAAVAATGKSGAEMAWCTEPTNGQSNRSTVVPAAQGAALNCAATVQCQLMNTFRCQRPEFHDQCWWLQDVGPYHGHLCVSKANADESYGDAHARIGAQLAADNTTRPR